MSLRQSILKAFYPIIMWFGQLLGNKQVLVPSENSLVAPPISFYTLHAQLNNGSILHFDSLKGKKVLIVNTASDCGFTAQYADLQKLYAQMQGRLEIIAFPANDFKKQEKGSDSAIVQFCKLNYGVGFPIAKKSIVISQKNQHEVFKWLSNKSQNGWNNQAPSWNFCKYLIDEEGHLTHYFPSTVSPLSKQFLKAVL